MHKLIKKPDKKAAKFRFPANIIRTKINNQIKLKETCHIYNLAIFRTLLGKITNIGKNFYFVADLYMYNKKIS